MIANLDAGKPNAFEQIERATVGTTDHAIVPVLDENFFKRGEKVANLGIKVLSTIPHQTAIDLLVRAGIYLPWNSTRKGTVNVLAQRQPQDYLPLTIHALSDISRESNAHARSTNSIGRTITSHLLLLETVFCPLLTEQ